MRFVSYVAPFIFVGILYAVAIPIKDPRSPPSNSAPHQLSTITSTQDQTNLNLNIHPTPLQKRKNEPKTPDEIHRAWVNSAQQSLKDARTELALHKGILTLNEVIPKSKNGGRGPVGPVDPKKKKKKTKILEEPQRWIFAKLFRIMHGILREQGHYTVDYPMIIRQKHK